MLCQGVYFSSLMEKTDGWFFLDQTGDPGLGDDEKGNIFQRVGSWKALGCGGPDRQKKIRDKLVSLDLLTERRATMPARIWYRFDPGNYLIFLSSLAKNQDSGNPETGLGKSRNLISEIPKLDSGNPGHKKINKEINKKINTHPAHRAGTHPAKPDGEGNVSERPADAHKQAEQILAQWTPGRRKEGLRILHAMRRQDGSAMTPADWDQMLEGLRRAKDQSAWLHKVDATGWDPRRIQDVARPGESAAAVKQRLLNERDLQAQTQQKAVADDQLQITYDQALDALLANKPLEEAFVADRKLVKDVVSLDLYKKGGIESPGLASTIVEFAQKNRRVFPSTAMAGM